MTEAIFMTNEAEAKLDLGVVLDAKEVFGRRYRHFTDLVGELQASNEVKKQAEAESKRLNGLLQEMWADVPAKTVMNDGAKITLVSSSNSHISKDALLLAGVPATVIRDCTKVTPYQYVLVTEPKGGK
jgi:hypothetical protein